MNKTLQSSVFPTIGLSTEEKLFFRLNNLATIDINNKKIIFNQGGIARTDTYFNSVTVGKWKSRTNVEQLSFTISYCGKLKLTWYINQPHQSKKIVFEKWFESDTTTTEAIDLTFWKDLKEGLLSFEARALNNSEIHDFRYSTSANKFQNIKLGIVITHFNRIQFAVPAAKRIREQLLKDPSYTEKVDLFIVDNSQNLPKDELEGITIIPNQNFGGSGGFSRGLIELKKQGKFTHALFMDDDASCEIESIRRTISLLELAKDDRMAIAGAMLREAEEYRQFENGAHFDGLCRPINSGLDLRSCKALMTNEQEQIIDYGGWWFFAFPIKHVEFNAFPFFVRGDDIGFSLAHNFDIMTMNGICSWQDDFALKTGPLPTYLDTRSHLLQNLHGFVGNDYTTALKICILMFARNALTYHYETAHAATLAVKDVLKGPDFWRENADMKKRRPEITGLIKNEKVVRIDPHIKNMAKNGIQSENIVKKTLRWATLNGHLIPKLFFKKGLVWQEKGFGGRLRETFLFSEILYYHEPTSQGFILKHNKFTFFKICFKHFIATLILMLKYRKLKAAYKSTYREMTSDSFWSKQFGN